MFVHCHNFTNSLVILGDVILWVTGLLHYNVRRKYIIVLNIGGDENLWVRVTDEILCTLIRH